MTTSRRAALAALAAGAAGTAVGAYVANTQQSPDLLREDLGLISPIGQHQPGITTPTQQRVDYVAFALRPQIDAHALARLLRLWSDDIRALMTGKPAPGDFSPELATQPHRLTITMGLGLKIFQLAGLVHKKPDGFVDIPRLAHYRLEPAWKGGDLICQIGADSPLSVSHAIRRLAVDAEPFATMIWHQSGFWQHPPQGSPIPAGRNLMGQVDGTANLKPENADFAKTVWIGSGPDWAHNGTMMVIRRTRMNLDTWDQLTQKKQDEAIGRLRETGAPIGSSVPTDDLPLESKKADGSLLIAANAHARLAHPKTNNDLRIFRRGVNYDNGMTEGATPDSGLIFVSYQADIARQFIPIIQRLDASDELNKWTVAVGSEVFIIPPGLSATGFLADKLFE